MHQYHDLIELFNHCFAKAENTRLIKGDGEPVYLPANSKVDYHQVVFANGYYASALHEIAHWCIAGKARRKLEDYGYWYCPDGRNAQQQTDFQLAELKPQAIERAFSEAAGFPFRISTDNLNGVEPDHHGFEQQVSHQYQQFQIQGFPDRAVQFIAALREYYCSETATKLFANADTGQACA